MARRSQPVCGSRIPLARHRTRRSRADAADSNQLPTKWEVYEQILRIPYYVVFDRYTNQLQVFILYADRYTELNLEEPRLWIPSLELGLGLWQGVYQGVERLWLRWCDAEGNWLLTPSEQEQQRAEQERQRAERLAARLREAGIDPDEM